MNIIFDDHLLFIDRFQYQILLCIVKIQRMANTLTTDTQSFKIHTIQRKRPIIHNKRVYCWTLSSYCVYDFACMNKNSMLRKQFNEIESVVAPSSLLNIFELEVLGNESLSTNDARANKMRAWGE